jgi:hypothetical protein
VPVVASIRIDEEGFVTVIIGIDPHKATHMAVAIDSDEQSVARFEVRAQRNQTQRLRLNPRGNRKLNHAMHLIAVSQIAHDTPGRVYYDRKIAEGKTKKEVVRALKRRISDAVWRQLHVAGES